MFCTAISLSRFDSAAGSTRPLLLYSQRDIGAKPTTLPMAFLLSKANSGVLSRLRSHSARAEGEIWLPRRGFHVEPGPREKALLAPDPVLSRFKSTKKSVKTLKRIGDVLTIVVVAGCCYEIYVKATMREEARSKAASNGGSA
ncbi:hypothetical protein MLD38_027943 [Melastoma candidum]|uniref:Uncharacterized protein n=1 Tax=Melastoma candidum TaxID=119954 RepID=A0ACB9N1T8_9MYRT|nr:hypothetical protein MLD38_027943 [Melastoma candidum]